MTNYIVSSGVTSSGLLLINGGMETVLSGGTTFLTTVGTGGSLDVKSEGRSISTTISSGGSATVELGGNGSSTVVKSGGYETIAGTEVGSVISNGGTQTVGGSGVALNTTVSSGGRLIVSSEGIPTSSGFMPTLVAGGSAISTTLAGGLEDVFRGGTASGVVVNNGGFLRLGYGAGFLGGSASNVVINAGGSASLLYVGSLSGVVVYTGGVLDNVGGHVSGAVLSGGVENVGADTGIDYDAVVLAGGLQTVSGNNSNGKTSGTVVSSGGQQLVTRENIAFGTIVKNGGLQNVDWEGITSGTIISSGGLQLLQNTVDPGQRDVPPTAFASVVSNGGNQTVGVEGRTSGTILSSGGLQVISSGGIASGTIIYAGGVESILSGGLAVGTIVYGGTQNIGSGNTILGTNLIDGGLQNVASGGMASGTVVYSGGTQAIAAGGIADGTTIQFGVSQVVGAGAIVSGAVIEAGGRLVLSPGSIVSDTHLKLGGTIDLPNLAFSSAETVSITPQSIASYLLTVQDGGQTQTLQLGNNPPGTLRLSDDGSGGTAITAVGSLTGNISVDAGVLSRSPNNPTTSASISAAMMQALADWGQYIQSDRPLNIQIDIGTTTYPTELADDIVSFLPLPGRFHADVGTRLDGIAVSEAIAGIASGQAFASPDITITINQAELNSIYFPSDPSGPYQVPADKIDLVSLFEHEVGHAIGFDGLRDQSGALENAESVFDTWMNVSGGSASLVSPAEQNQFGGQPVPLTTGASNGANNYTLATAGGSSLSDDLMGQSLKSGQRYQISGLDLAAVETAGVPAGLGYYASVGVNQVLAPVSFDSEPATFIVTERPNSNIDDITWQLPGITNPNPSTVYQIQREIWLTTSAYQPGSSGFLVYSEIEPYVDTAAAGLSGGTPSLLPTAGTYDVTYVLAEQDGAGRYVQEQAIPGGTITLHNPNISALTNYTPSQPDEGSDSNGQGNDSGSGESGIGANDSAGQADPTQAAVLPIYRFFDTNTGTHLFTQSQSEARDILQTRPDLKEETDNFGATPLLSPTAVPVYRFFENGNGTHFFTADYNEYAGLTTAGTPSYRPDLTYEPNSTLYVDTIQQTGDVAVYRLFDSTQGTQFLTGNEVEYQGLTTPGSGSYRPDLNPEGIAFYAPAGSSFLYE